MNTISNTAWYCCGVRMEDAERKRSVCNDHYAKRFMDERGMKIFEPFKSETMPNISNISRCRIIDDFLKEETGKNKNVNVITIGAGFDTRPYRLAGGKWTEIDEPQIIDYKNKKLPVEECKNTLQRISINFSKESLKAKLASLKIDQPPVIIVEGVFMYLEPEAINDTLVALQVLYPEHVLICDLMTRNFFEKFAQKIHAKLVTAGGQFTLRPVEPDAIFINNNYKKIENIPMYKRATELGIFRDRLKVPDFVFRLLLKFLVKDLNGYSVTQFQFG